MYQYLLPDIAVERIADRRREAAARRRVLAVDKAPSAPAAGKTAGRPAGRAGLRGLLPGRRAAACENC
jgi:hypothetical protein